MHARTLLPPGSAPPPPRRRRGFPWVRITIVLLLVAAVVYVLLPRWYFVSADGLVEGQLVSVGPLFEARVVRLYHQCGEPVTRGQILATVTNFLLQGQYQQAYQRSVNDLNESQITQSQGLDQALTNELTVKERYESALYAARKLAATKDAYGTAFRNGAIGKSLYDETAADWQAANAQARSLASEVAEAGETVTRVTEASRQRVSGLNTATSQISALENQVGSQSLTAPISGALVECPVAQPQAIVAPGTPIFKIFSAQRAYIVAYFDPKTAWKVHNGDSATLIINGVQIPLEGRVMMIYPTLSALPDQLTKYFWQHQQWAEYRPVKIDITNASPQVKAQLAYDAQVQIRIRQRSFGWNGWNIVGLK